MCGCLNFNSFENCGAVVYRVPKKVSITAEDDLHKKVIDVDLEFIWSYIQLSINFMSNCSIYNVVHNALQNILFNKWLTFQVLILLAFTFFGTLELDQMVNSFTQGHLLDLYRNMFVLCLWHTYGEKIPEENSMACAEIIFQVIRLPLSRTTQPRKQSFSESYWVSNIYNIILSFVWEYSRVK